MSKKAPKNHNLIRKLEDAERDAYFDSVLRHAKTLKSDPVSLVRDAFSPQSKTCFAKEVQELCKQHPFTASTFRKVLTVVAERSSILEDTKNLRILFWLSYWYEFKVRPIDDWKPRVKSVRRQLQGLVRHLYAKYSIPDFMESAWLDCYGQGLARNREQEWYIHVGAGQNIRTAHGLPFPMTSKMAHHAFQAPDGLKIREAFRYGQAIALGAAPRLAKAIAQSRLARENWGHEEFWQSVMALFIRHQDMLDVSQFDPVVDYIYNQRFVPQYHNNRPAQPNMSMSGRTPETLIHQTEVWHRQVNRAKTHGAPYWNSCGVGGYLKVEGEGINARTFEIVELTKATELNAEGSAMSHCVGSYGASCSTGRCAIYSLRVTQNWSMSRIVTIEVTLSNRMIVQVKGKRNESPTGLAERHVRAWAQQQKLQIAGHALRGGW